MKKLVVVLLVVAVFMSLGVSAMAAGSPTNSGSSSSTSSATPAAVANDRGIYNAQGEKIATVAPGEIQKVAVGRANSLDDEDKDAFLAAYEDAKNVEGKVVKYFFWFDIPDSYKEMDGFDYYRYDFTCTGKNVEVQVNGNPMEVVSLGGINYYAKLTEFGPVAILCD